MSISSSTPTLQVGLTPDEKSLYSQIFKSLDTESTGIITGEKARITFEESGLPPTILGEIWQVADSNNLGFLTQFGFCQAMRLIGYAQAGHHPTPEMAQSPGPLPKFASSNLKAQPAPLYPQSTNNSFMQTQPSSIVPQNTATLNTKPQDPISSVNDADYSRFSQLFVKTVGSLKGYLDGARAREIFLKAKLPIDILGQIWNLVDKENVGRLDVDAFVVAMYLIQGLLSGKVNQLPPFLPETIWLSVERHSKQSFETSSVSRSRQSSARQVDVPNSSRITSQTQVQSGTSGSDWVVDSAMKRNFDNIFDGIDKDKTGKLSPDQVASFLMTSNLNQQDLALVWDLADIQNTGIFTKVEFSIALYLVNKRSSGEKLPNIVPDSLIDSIKSLTTKEATSNNSFPSTDGTGFKSVTGKPAAAPTREQKSSIDDLLDVFGSTSSDKTDDRDAPTSISKDPADITPSSTELNQTNTLPKARSSITNTFKPSSTFGQTLIQNKPPSVFNTKINSETRTSPVEKSLEPSHQNIPVNEASTINYAALRAVPPPPRKTRTFEKREENSSSDTEEFSSSAKAVTNVPTSVPHANDDLLADNSSEVASQLSQANTDIANISNQVKSLSSQTTGLHDKKSRSERELSKILSTKQEIDRKLKSLRSSYEHEVKQVEQVDSALLKAKEETEALRSEASISEAKFNALMSQLNGQREEKEVIDKENNSLKEKLSSLNTEAASLQSELAQMTKENQLLVNQLSVKKSQVQVAIVKVEELKGKIASMEISNRQAEEEASMDEQKAASLAKEESNLQAKVQELQSNKFSTKIKGAESTSSVVQRRGLGDDFSNTSLAAAGVTSLVNHAPQSVAVDDVVNSPSGDMTGVDDLNEVGSIENKTHESNEERGNVEEKEGTLNDAFKNLEIKNRNNETNTNASSVTTDSKNNEDETPVTSPNTSDFQFPQSDAGIAGGMVGMPGVLVGVQRTESLTSSIQNNAALSVRDDNIDDISDKETLDNQAIMESEDTVPNSANTESYSNRVSPFNMQENAQQEVVSDGDKGSSGVGSFEIVNADDLKASESQHSDERLQSEEPEIEARETSMPVLNHNHLDTDQEFPPIKELDYEESSSSDSQDESFDDAVDNLPQTYNEEPGNESDRMISSHNVAEKEPAMTSGSNDFDDVFNNLQPATEEARGGNDLFDENFDDLEVANYDEGDDFNENNGDFGFSSTFTNDHFVKQSNIPEQKTTDNTNGGSDEWEQLFAGFGNKSDIQSSPNGNADVKETHTLGSSHEADIQELVEMGFEREVAISALERADWNIESATNYLLDNS